MENQAPPSRIGQGTVVSWKFFKNEIAFESPVNYTPYC